MGYVMLSRVETIEQLYIQGDPPDNKFYADQRALDELERLEKVSVNKNKPNWEQNFAWCRKIALLNCRSLASHIEDIKHDFMLLHSDIICLNETWLMSNLVQEHWNIPGYHLHLNSVGSGKGIGTYIKADIITPKSNVTKEKVQITLLSSPELDIINIYRSQGMDTAELANDLRYMINKSKLTIVCGDLNLCYIDDYNNELTKMFKREGFQQLVHEATHFMGGHIDQVYSNHNPQEYQVHVSLYSPYYLAKDHDAILITITKVPPKSSRQKRK